MIPLKTKEGTAVIYNPSPASRACYSGTARTMPKGATGAVTLMALPRGKRTYMPGPGGGLVYVDWDNYGTFGVSPLDLEALFIGAESKGGLR